MAYNSATDINLSEITNPRLLKTIHSANFATEYGAVTASGAPTAPQYWYLSGDVPVTSANMNLPKHINITATGGKFVRSGAGSLTVAAPILAKREQIFSGFDKTNLKISAAMDAVYPEWFGAVADNVTDDWAAIQLMFDAVRYVLGAASVAAGGYATGGVVKFAAGKSYYSSKTIRIRRSFDISGGGGKGWYTGTIVRFAPNTSGFVFESFFSEGVFEGASITANSTTLTAAMSFTTIDIGKDVVIIGAGAGGADHRATITAFTNATTVTIAAAAATGVTNTAAFLVTEDTAQWSKISNIALVGARGGNTHTINIAADLTVTATPDNLNRYRGFPQETTVTIDTVPGSSEGTTWALRYSPTGVPSLYLRFEALNAYQPMPADTIYTGGRYIFFSWMIGAVLRINKTDYKIRAMHTLAGNNTTGYQRVYLDNMDGTPANLPPGSIGTDAEFISIPGRGSVGSRVNSFHGINAVARINVDSVYVKSFAGNGFHMDTNRAGGVNGQENGNYFNISSQCAFYENLGSGVYLTGVNSNQGTIGNIDTNSNYGWGIYDESQQGNVYVGVHTAGNGMGGHFTVPSRVHQSTFLGCYDEAGQPNSILSSESPFFGGAPGSGYSKQSSAPFILGTRSVHRLFTACAIRVTNPYPILVGGGEKPPAVSAQIGSSEGHFPSILSMGNEDEYGAGHPTDPFPSYAIDYGRGTPGNGWYALSHGNGQKSSTGRTVLAWSGDSNVVFPDVAGQPNPERVQLWMPKGFYVGGDGNALAAKKKMGVDAKGLTFEANLRFTTNTAGVVLQSPNGTKYRITVADGGALSAVVEP